MVWEETYEVASNVYGCYFESNERLIVNLKGGLKVGKKKVKRRSPR